MPSALDTELEKNDQQQQTPSADGQQKQETPPASSVTPPLPQKDVLGTDGAPVVSKGAESLAGIFDKMAAGEDPFAKKNKEGASASDGDKAVAEAKEKADKEATDKAAAEKAKADANAKAKAEGGQQQQQKPKDEDELSDEDLQPSPLDKPKTQKRIQALLKKVEEANNIVATTKKEAEEKAKKLAELEAKLGKEGGSGSTALDDKVKAQLDELAMYRRRYELETDPEVKSKFDDQIAARDTDIIGILKANQAGEALIKAIEAEGGAAKFAKSNKVFKLADGSNITAKELFQNIRDRLTEGSPADALAFDAALQDQFRLQGEKTRYIEAERAKAKEYFEGREKQAKEQSEQLKTKVESWIAKTTSEDPAFKDLEIPANATPEQTKEIKDENIYRKQLRDVLRSSVYTNNPEEYLDIVKDATMLYPVKREAEKAKKALADKDAEIAKLKDELAKVRGASRTTPTNGSLGSGGAAPQVKKPAAARSIEDEFAAIAGQGE